ncbi:unnamed protein product [Lepidochelys olivacea]
MDPAQLYIVVVSITNTSHLILQYLLSRSRSCRVEQCDATQAALLEAMERSNSQLLATVVHYLDMVERRFWAQEISTDWLDHIVMQLWDDKPGLQNFQMCEATFMEQCEELSPALKCSNTKVRAALTVEKQVVIALWKLAMPDCYQSVRNEFGVGKSTVGSVVIQVARAINRHLLRRVVTMGNVQDIGDSFSTMGFPNCGGVIDGMHIPILAPGHLDKEYINQQRYFSMGLQALVNHRGHFTNINAGWSGKGHDTCIVRNSGLFRKLKTGTFFPD